MPVPQPPATESTQTEGTPPPAPRTFTQEEVNVIAAREKNQGRSAGLRDLATRLGVPENEEIDPALLQKALEEFRKNEAEGDRKAREVAQRESAAVERERVLAEKEAAADRRIALASAGVSATNIDDADALLAREVSTSTDLAAALTALQARRPELFTAPVEGTPPPSTDSRQQRPPRTPNPGIKPGDRGRERAAARFGTPSGGKG